MNRYSDIDPMDLDPNTGRPYSNYSSPSLDTSFHDGEMDVDDDDGCPVSDPDCLGDNGDCHDACEEPEFYSDDPRALQGMGLL